MLHLLPDPAPEPQGQPAPEAYAEAVSRLASVRHALRLVDPFGSGPASDADADAPVAVIVDGVPQDDPKQFNMHLFDVAQIEVLKGPQDGSPELQTLAKTDEVLLLGEEQNVYVKVTAARGDGWVKKILLRKQ